MIYGAAFAVPIPLSGCSLQAHTGSEELSFEVEKILDVWGWAWQTCCGLGNESQGEEVKLMNWESEIAHQPEPL